MPTMPLNQCLYPGCGAKCRRGYCEEHSGHRRREADQRRGSSTERGYDWTWRKAARAFLAEHPLCKPCLDDGRTTAATEVDHVVPHKGDQALFWDQDNWQAICKPCHVKKTLAEGGRWG